MGKKLNLIVTIVIAVMFLCSCQQIADEVKKAYNEVKSSVDSSLASNSTQSNASQYETYTYENIQVEIPKGWKIYEENSDNTTLEVNDRRIVFAKTQSDEVLDEQSVLQIMTGNNYRTADIVACNKTNICDGRVNAYTLEVKTEKNESYNMLAICFTHSGDFYTIALPVKKTGTDEWRDLFDKIVNSIVLLGNQSPVANNSETEIDSAITNNTGVKKQTYNDISFEIPKNWSYSEEDSKVSAGSEKDYTFVRMMYSFYEGNAVLSKSDAEKIVKATASDKNQYKNISTTKTTIGSEAITAYESKLDAISNGKTLKSCAYVFKANKSIYLAFYVCLDESQYDIFLENVETINNSIAIIPANQKELSFEEKNAARSAQSYINMMAFSRKGLIEQLEFEGYSKEASTNAVDSLNIDWKEQAYKSAKSYLDMMAMSKKELIEQLQFEGFTKEQAEYGAKSAGYK